MNFTLQRGQVTYGPYESTYCPRDEVDYGPYETVALEPAQVKESAA